VLLFAACFIHCWRSEGQRAAQQWFLIGFIFALVILSLLVVIQQLAYSPRFLTLGAAPSLIVMLYPVIFYFAYLIARRFVDMTSWRAMGYITFTIVPWLTLPLDALAVAAGWWYFPSESFSFLNGVPYYLPFAWGAVGATFVAMMVRIRRIRFRGNGQFFAMILAAPLVAGLDILLIALVQVFIDLLANLGGPGLLYFALGTLYLLFPALVLFNLPRFRSTAPAQPSRPVKNKP
jgi:hypothetical protein